MCSSFEGDIGMYVYCISLVSYSYKGLGGFRYGTYTEGGLRLNLPYVQRLLTAYVCASDADMNNLLSSESVDMSKYI